MSKLIKGRLQVDKTLKEFSDLDFSGPGCIYITQEEEAKPIDLAFGQPHIIPIKALEKGKVYKTRAHSYLWQSHVRGLRHSEQIPGGSIVLFLGLLHRAKKVLFGEHVGWTFAELQEIEDDPVDNR